MGAQVKKNAAEGNVVPMVARIQQAVLSAPGPQVEGQLQTTFDAAKGFLIDDQHERGVRIDKPGVCSLLIPWAHVRYLAYRPLPVEK